MHLRVQTSHFIHLIIYYTCACMLLTEHFVDFRKITYIYCIRTICMKKKCFYEFDSAITIIGRHNIMSIENNFRNYTLFDKTLLILAFVSLLLKNHLWYLASKKYFKILHIIWAQVPLIILQPEARQWGTKWRFCMPIVGYFQILY